MRYRRNAKLLASDAAELLREQGIPVMPQAIDVGDDIDAEVIRLGDSVEIAELPEGTFMVSVWRGGEWDLESVEYNLDDAVSVASVCYSGGHVANARKPNGRLQMGEGKLMPEHTRILRSSKLTARNKGDSTSATLSAGYYAKKTGKTMYLYRGNSYGHSVWRVSDKPSDYLSSINNTGAVVISVEPDLTVREHQLSDGEMRRNATSASKRCWGELTNWVYYTPRGKKIVVAGKANRFRFYYADTNVQVGPEVSYLRGVLEYAASKGWVDKDDWMRQQHREQGVTDIREFRRARERGES